MGIKLVSASVVTQENSEEKVAQGNKTTALLKSWMDELDGYYKQMIEFRDMEPDMIFVELSGWTSRASHMRSQINRTESKVLQGFRTKQIDPFICECERQFKMWSRVFSVNSLDWNLQRGNT